MISAPTLLSSLTAVALPFSTVSQDLCQMSQIVYDSKIEVSKVSSSFSLFGCPIEEYKIWGQDPVSLKARAVNLSFYRARGETSKSAAVIILPPTGGVNILDRGYANELCSAGISAVIVSSWEHQDSVGLELNTHDIGAARALAAIRHAVEFLEFNEIHSIGVLGTSIGAIAGVLAFGVEPRILAAALIVGSARFADVVAESDEAGAARLRKERMEQWGFASVEDYRESLRKAIGIEPFHFLKDTRGRPSLVVTADSDTTVPTPYQEELVQMLDAKNIRLRGNHLRGIKDAFYYHRREITDFFSKTLEVKHSSSPLW